MTRDVLFARVVETAWIAREIGALNARDESLAPLIAALDEALPVLDAGFVRWYRDRYGHPPDRLSGYPNTEALRQAIARERSGTG